MEIRVFGSFEELLDALRAEQEKVDAQTGDYGKHFQPGAKFARFDHPGIIIYGEVLDVVATEKNAGANAEEVEFIKKAYLQPHMRNLRFCRCFSQMVPSGELGNVHVASMQMKLTDEDFEKVRVAGWPITRLACLKTLGIELSTKQPIEA